MDVYIQRNDSTVFLRCQIVSFLWNVAQVGGMGHLFLFSPDTAVSQDLRGEIWRREGNGRTRSFGAHIATQFDNSPKPCYYRPDV